MLNADGNDHDTRWNINQVDLNRKLRSLLEYLPNYPTWKQAPSVNPELSCKFDLYERSSATCRPVHHHAIQVFGLMLYPWGKWPEQPSDSEMFHYIKDEVNSNISDIPIRNANQGLYPNCGTSRDYGYGVMGYPTFTFETDDEQFLLGTLEPLSERLGEESGCYEISNR